MQPSTLARTALLPFALLLAGCQTYTQQTADRDAALRSGNFTLAVSAANRDAEKNRDNKDTVLYRLEQGSILRAAALADIPLPAVASPAPATAVTTPQNDTNVAAQTETLSPAQAYLKQSIEAFDAADEKITRYEEEAKVQVGSEFGANLTNQANLPYVGRAYDKVMMNTYKTLGYLQVGDVDAARVELNRALQRQRDAVEANAKRIEAAQEQAAAAREGGVTDEQGRQGSAYDVDRAKTDPTTGAGLAAIEAEVDSKIKAYGDYVNPFAVFLDGLFFLYHGSDSSDLERARKSLERVAGMVPENAYIAADLQAATELKAPENVTYVIFETGSAPYRDQIRIDIPTFLVTSSISYVGAAFPRLAYVNDYAPALSVNDGAAVLNTSVVADMDSVVSLDFKNEWPSIVTRTLISTATKAVLDAVIQKQASDQFGLGGMLATKLLTAATQASMNIADTRTWRTLPKEFQYARVATPASRQLTLSTGMATRTIQLEPGSVNVVYVKSLCSTSPLLVSQFALK